MKVIAWQYQCTGFVLFCLILVRSGHSVRSVRSPITKQGKYLQRHLVEKGNLVSQRFEDECGGF